MAQQTIDNGETGLVVRGKINDNFTELYDNLFELNTSEIYPTKLSYQVAQQVVGPDTNDKPIEIVNLGYTGHGPTDDIHENVTGLIRINGRIDMVRNMQWDQANAKWLTPIQTASGYGSSCIETGGEGASMHSTPTGANFGDCPSMGWLVSALGPRGVPGYTSGYVNQSTRPIYIHYASSAYQVGKLNSWGPSTTAEPLLHLHMEETKGTDNELGKIEANLTGDGGAFYFLKSRGTYATKTVIADTEVIGLIGWKGYDGDQYSVTAKVQAVIAGTVANNQMPTELQFYTTTTNSPTKRMTITKDGYLVLATIPTSSAGLGTGTIWSDAGTLKIV